MSNFCSSRAAPLTSGSPFGCPLASQLASSFSGRKNGETASSKAKWGPLFSAFGAQEAGACKLEKGRRNGGAHWGAFFDWPEMGGGRAHWRDKERPDSCRGRVIRTRWGH